MSGDGNPSAKLDAGLREALRVWEATRAASEPDASLSLTLGYEGDLAAIEALRFETHATWADQALGVVRYADVLAVAAHPNVVSMRIGGERRKDDDLEFAIPDVHVRSSTSANADGLWFAESANTNLTAPPGAAGGTAIVAIIDTGIDYTHPMFHKQSSPARLTRIRAIWDQGLVPAVVGECPKKALLLSADTYGVEYSQKQIDDALAGVAPILHKDCDGHGTHCAGIAAGGTLTPIGSGSARRVGVAPRADIIVVKLLDVEGPVKFKMADNSIGGDVFFENRFRDAIVWCLRKARELSKPVVISVSLGSAREAGDGIDADAEFVDTLFDPAKAAGDMNFPKGAILVKSAGNNGQAKRHGVVKFSAAGTIAVPLKLEDSRGGNDKRWDHCRRDVYKPGIGATFWYRRNFDNVKFALQLPHEGAPSATKLGVGTAETRGFELVIGPPPSVTVHPPAPAVHRATLDHGDDLAVKHPNGTTIRRHSVNFTVQPKESGGTISYATGVYEVHITAPAGTEVFVMGHRDGWGAGEVVRTSIADTLASGAARSADITVTPELTATDPLGQHVITVSAYDDADGATGAATFHRIAPFSSRGPLRDFSSPAQPKVADKPDVSAPGVKIFSARGADTDVSWVTKLLPAWKNGDRFIDFSGTSMATPLVAGIVALFLDKKSTLNITDVRTHLHFGVRPGLDLAGADHDHAFGEGLVDGRKSHGNVP